MRRFKEQLKGNDLVARWDDDTFAIILPHTPAKASTVVSKRIEEVFASPFTYGVEDSEQVQLEPQVGTQTLATEGSLEEFVNNIAIQEKGRNN